MVCWTVFALLWVAGVHAVKALLASVTFVSFLSLYANWATDLSSVQAALAAIRSGRTERAVKEKDSAELRMKDPTIEVEEGEEFVTPGGQRWVYREGQLVREDLR